MDGIIIINKEKGYTSHDIVKIVKKLFNEKVGHTGTLDPMATGVLPLLIGKATQISKYLINHDKTYTAKLKLGILTDTSDITGNIIETKKVDWNQLEESKIIETLNKLLGKQQQKPPMYSAIKINGKKLYEYARNGEKIDIPSREITIYEIKLNSIDKANNEIEFTVKCSKGTYIRTLCENIATLLGTIGTMSCLNRETVGEFSIQKSVTIEELKQNINNENFLNEKIISIEKIFKNKNKIILNPRSYISFLNGMKLFTDEPNDIYKIYTMENDFVGIGMVDKGILKRDIVI